MVVAQTLQTQQEYAIDCLLSHPEKTFSVRNVALMPGTIKGLFGWLGRILKQLRLFLTHKGTHPLAACWTHGTEWTRCSQSPSILLALHCQIVCN